MKLLVAVSASIAFCWGPSATSVDSAPTTTTTTTLVSQSIMAKWYNVAWCETHADWDRNRSNFDGGLGISRTNWVAYGGLDFAPAPHLATPQQQVWVAQQIQAHNNVAGYIPDQDGSCNAW
jgi:resuscitation-promoting factor RpfB